MRSVLSAKPHRTGDHRPRDSFGWVPVSSNFVPLSDSEAAALVIPMTENRQADNANPNSVVGDANHYVPSAAELNTYLTVERDIYNLLAADANPYCAYVTGHFPGNTDEIIQWATIKWGLPTDWTRAQACVESNWRHTGMGDNTLVKSSLAYPAYTRIDATHVNQSVGIMSCKWNYPDDDTVGMGIEPLRWKSTAFNLDYYACYIRFEFDDPQGKRTLWGDSEYQRGQNWLSLAAWYEPYPWNNQGQRDYMAYVQSILAQRIWEQPGFPPAVPR